MINFWRKCSLPNLAFGYFARDQDLLNKPKKIDNLKIKIKANTVHAAEQNICHQTMFIITVLSIAKSIYTDN